ncbi:hypothetical protein NPIL_277601 [Nephila pilipes]|uniref:Uncharacterized protein n=1 Tax=Nephila pilipes TaxID=299642 RepID=A0A8X6P838_NEPPI|nr:hypothetical protein NPIL_277601 [Nephila pilipes]
MHSQSKLSVVARQSSLSDPFCNIALVDQTRPPSFTAQLSGLIYSFVLDVETSGEEKCVGFLKKKFLTEALTFNVVFILLSAYLDDDQTRVTSYHPQSNGTMKDSIVRSRVLWCHICLNAGCMPAFRQKEADGFLLCYLAFGLVTNTIPSA